MSYIDIEQQLNAITRDLQQKLENAGAVDKKGDTKDIAKFNQIIDATIDKCGKILQKLEMEPYDPNSVNIVQSRIQWLRTVRENQTLNWLTNANSEEEKIIKGQNYGSLREVFQDGAKRVTRLFGFQRKHAPQKTVREK